MISNVSSFANSLPLPGEKCVSTLVVLGKYFPGPITLTQFISLYNEHLQPRAAVLSVSPCPCLLATADRGYSALPVLPWYAAC